MRILVVSDEAWNDEAFPNGILTNWLAGLDAEFAHVYCSPGLPLNSVCGRYFRIADGEMARSTIGLCKAGRAIDAASAVGWGDEPAPIYSVMKKISRWAYAPVLMIRDAIWLWGRYDIEALKEFIDSFNPDVVFCLRRATPKMLRLEALIGRLAGVPMVAHTGDDETMRHQPWHSPLYWLRKLLMQRMFRRCAGNYSRYIVHSAEQAEYYRNDYGIDARVLMKCGERASSLSPKRAGSPITLVYAGHLYCKRWQTLAQVGRALSVINADGVKMRLDIYTGDSLSRRQLRALSQGASVRILPAVPADELKEVSRGADVLLHVEALGMPDADMCRVSFSTKVIDLLFSQTAVMAVCDANHAALRYLSERDAAICVSSPEDIEPALRRICSNPALLQEYREKAFAATRALDRAVIQKQLIEALGVRR